MPQDGERESNSWLPRIRFAARTLAMAAAASAAQEAAAALDALLRALERTSKLPTHVHFLEHSHSAAADLLHVIRLPASQVAIAQTRTYLRRNLPNLA